MTRLKYRNDEDGLQKCRKFEGNKSICQNCALNQLTSSLSWVCHRDQISFSMHLHVFSVCQELKIKDWGLICPHLLQSFLPLGR